MQYLLHIDTSGDTGTIAVAGDGKLLALRTNTESRNHAAVINTMIGDVLADADITLTDLAGIAVCGGPGSYTGLRIGVATAKGLCYALDKPLLMHNKLTLLAHQVYISAIRGAAQYITLLPAREQEYFIAAYDTDFKCTIEPQHIMENQLATLVEKKENSYLITEIPDAIDLLSIPGLGIHSNTQIDVEAWILYAFSEIKCMNIVNLAAAEPFYLKQVYTHK